VKQRNERPENRRHAQEKQQLDQTREDLLRRPSRRVGSGAQALASGTRAQRRSSKCATICGKKLEHSPTICARMRQPEARDLSRQQDELSKIHRCARRNQQQQRKTSATLAINRKCRTSSRSKRKR